MARIFHKYLSQATTHVEKMAIQYLDEQIEGLDEEHVAQWSSECMTINEAVLVGGMNLVFFLKKHDLEGLREEVIAGAIKYTATYWLEEGGIIFPSSKVPAKPKANFKVSSVV